MLKTHPLNSVSPLSYNNSLGRTESCRVADHPLPGEAPLLGNFYV